MPDYTRSILIPYFNRPQHIALCVASIQRASVAAGLKPVSLTEAELAEAAAHFAGYGRG
jgi:hypothetical protein